MANQNPLNKFIYVMIRGKRSERLSSSVLEIVLMQSFLFCGDTQIGFENVDEIIHFLTELSQLEP